MTDTLVHRGPDAEGLSSDLEAGLTFGHRRLSIVDLSEQGRQPMWSRSGRYCITYNGEVYNAPEIRGELQRRGIRIPWRGHSDTEVVVEAIDALGLGPALRMFRGMFAFALWDRETRELALVRDRLGIKPLLYARTGFGVAFASELRAFHVLPTFRRRLNRSALAAYLTYAVVPGDQCILHGVRKVPPGAIVRWNTPDTYGQVERYWSAHAVAMNGARHSFEGTAQEGIEELERRLAESVALRMRSDVPFGAFLSGGVDSSTVVALAQSQTSTRLKTFCIGSPIVGYDESEDAKAVARHLGCDHHTLLADASDALGVIPELADAWDEPFADSSQIPTLMVSRLTREHVTVSLSGDGGDELVAGYNRHAWAPRVWGTAARLPRVLRRALGALELVQVADWDRTFRSVGLGSAIRLPGDKLHKLAKLATVDTPEAFYQSLRSHWADPQSLLARPFEPTSPSTHAVDGPFAARMMYQDMVEYLPDDILTKVDRASMAVSLEARVPLLDHQVVELAWQFPLDWKIRRRAQKWILKQVLARHVPAELVARPKMGFGVPVGRWLRGPLEPWAAELLDPKTVRADGIFESQTLSQTWNAHLAGRGNHEHRLWAVLMFQSWWQRNRGKIEA